MINNIDTTFSYEWFDYNGDLLSIGDSLILNCNEYTIGSHEINLIVSNECGEEITTNDLIIEKNGIEINNTLQVNSQTYYNDLVDFNSNVNYHDNVFFNSNVYFTDFNGNGTTILDGIFEVNDDVFRIEGSNIYIGGKVHLLDELVDIDFGMSNLYVHIDSYFNSNLSVLFNDQPVFEVESIFSISSI